MESKTRIDRLGLVTRIFCILLLLSLLVVMLITEASRAADAVLRERVEERTFAGAQALSGYLFRNEEALQSSNNGPVDYAVANGAAVEAGTEVARAYVDDTATDKRERAAALYAQIDALQAALDAAADLDGRAHSYTDAYRFLMTRKSAGEQYVGAESLGVIATLLSGRDAATPDVAAALEQQITACRAQLDELVRYVDRPQSVSCTTAGSFYKNTDGYEALFGADAAIDLTPDALTDLLAVSQSTAGNVGKVVQDGYFRLALPVEAADAALYAVGEAYAVRFEQDEFSLTLVLEQINFDAAGERALLIFGGEGLPQGIELCRRQSVLVYTRSVTGLCIPADALTEDGTVFIDEDGTARARRVEVIGTEQGAMLVRPADEQAPLCAGDRVLVSARRIYDGKVLS